MKLLDISMELESVPQESIMGMAIQIALRENKLGECLKMILDRAEDNRPMMAGIIGDPLLVKIESYYCIKRDPCVILVQRKQVNLGLTVAHEEWDQNSYS